MSPFGCGERPERDEPQRECDGQARAQHLVFVLLSVLIFLLLFVLLLVLDGV